MEGVEFLDVSSTLVNSSLLYYCIFIVVLFIVAGCILVLNGITNALFVCTLVCVLCFLITFNASKTSHTIITIKVAGKVDMKKFHSTYEVLSKEGNIYQVKEKEN